MLGGRRHADETSGSRRRTKELNIRYTKVIYYY